MESSAVASETPAAATRALYVLDLESYLTLHPENKIWQYDVINLVTALQGLVNRDEPQLYVLYVRDRLSSSGINIDRFWLEKIHGGRGFLADHELIPIDSLEELLRIFRSYFSAIVLWDPKLPATGNVALTVAGADGMLPIRHDPSPDSLYSQLVSGGPRLPVQVRLSDKFTAVNKIPDTSLDTTTTPKTDAYIWAKSLYLESGACSPEFLGFFPDPADEDPRAPGYQYPDLQKCMIVNRDYYIARKAFFLDLDPWWDEPATDGPKNPFFTGIDQKILLDILKSAHERTASGERMIQAGGFVPWWFKYSNAEGGTGKHTPEETAEEFLGALSAFNGILDADGAPFPAIANASVFQHFPGKERYFQNPVPPARPLEKKNYLLFVIGAFQSSAMLYQAVPFLWNDLFRGEIPIAWAVSPLLSERVPHIFDYLYETRTPNDYFVSGGAGAGLCFINRLSPPNRPSELGDALPLWIDFSKALYRRFDLHATVAADLRRESRNTVFTELLQTAFMTFSPQGVATLKPFQTPLAGNLIPFIQETAYFPNKLLPLDQAAETIFQASAADKPTFQVYRFNLANPTALVQLYQRLQASSTKFQYELTDPYTFFYLLRQHLAPDDPTANALIPAYLSHTIPIVMQPGATLPATVDLRNDGWDIWNGPETPAGRRCRLTYSWIYEGETTATPGLHPAYIEGPVPPGQPVRVSLLIVAPVRAGLYRLILQFEQENVRASYLEDEIRILVK
ncbi:MAG: GxGYxYP domain-containing protein [bacterium]